MDGRVVVRRGGQPCCRTGRSPAGVPGRGVRRRAAARSHRGGRRRRRAGCRHPRCRRCRQAQQQPSRSRIHRFGLSPSCSPATTRPSPARSAKRSVSRSSPTSCSADKVAAIAKLQSRGKVVAMIGDGGERRRRIGSRPISAWRWGAAPTWRSRPLTSPLVNDDLRGAATAIRLSRATLRTIKTNLFWAFVYNVAAIPLAAFGLLNPMPAGAAMASPASSSSEQPALAPFRRRIDHYRPEGPVRRPRRCPDRAVTRRPRSRGRRFRDPDLCRDTRLGADQEGAGPGSPTVTSPLRVSASTVRGMASRKSTAMLPWTGHAEPLGHRDGLVGDDFAGARAAFDLPRGTAQDDRTVADVGDDGPGRRSRSLLRNRCSVRTVSRRPTFGRQWVISPPRAHLSDGEGFPAIRTRLCVPSLSTTSRCAPLGGVDQPQPRWPRGRRGSIGMRIATGTDAVSTTRVRISSGNAC